MGTQNLQGSQFSLSHIKKCYVLKKDMTNHLLNEMFHFCVIYLFFVDKANQGGPDTINYKEHKYCQMGVAASVLKVSYNPLVRVEFFC